MFDVGWRSAASWTGGSRGLLLLVGIVQRLEHAAAWAGAVSRAVSLAGSAYSDPVNGHESRESSAPGKGCISGTGGPVTQRSTFAQSTACLLRRRRWLCRATV